MGVSPWHEKHELLAAVAAWWRSLIRGDERPFETEYLALQEATQASQRLITGEPDDARGRLLLRRMERLGLDPNEVARTDPPLFQELQAACLLCEAPGGCARALRDESIDPAWQDWRDYCPNSTKLRILSTLKQCD